MFNADANLMEKWGPVLNHDGIDPISNKYKKAVTARLLENQEIALSEERAQAQGNFISEAAAANNIGTGSAPNNIGTFDPVLISLVRRAMLNFIAYDVVGV
jgi:hypothetical protein